MGCIVFCLTVHHMEYGIEWNDQNKRQQQPNNVRDDGFLLYILYTYYTQNTQTTLKTLRRTVASLSSLNINKNQY